MKIFIIPFFLLLLPCLSHAQPDTEIEPLLIDINNNGVKDLIEHFKGDLIMTIDGIKHVVSLEAYFPFEFLDELVFDKNVLILSGYNNGTGGFSWKYKFRYNKVTDHIELIGYDDFNKWVSGYMKTSFNVITGDWIIERIQFDDEGEDFTITTQKGNKKTDKIILTALKSEDLFSLSDGFEFPPIETFEDYWELIAYEGDLNGDSLTDKIVVFEKKCDSLSYSFGGNARCRRVAIYIKLETKFILHGYNDDIVECSDCGGIGVGDPFQKIVIKNQYFSIETLYGACDKTFIVTTFKYDDISDAFYLYKIGSEDYSCREEANPNNEINIRTKIETEKDFGKVRFEDF
jgi:hypothetical protein